MFLLSRNITGQVIGLLLADSHKLENNRYNQNVLKERLDQICGGRLFAKPLFTRAFDTTYRRIPRFLMDAVQA